MTQQRSSTLRYKSLVIDTIRQKNTYLLIGSTIFFILFFIGTWFLINSPEADLFKPREKAIQRVSKQVQKLERIYTAKPGDHLWKIAEEVYGSGYNAFDIAKANNLINNDLVSVGQTLSLPNIPPKAPTLGEITATKTERVINPTVTYTVQTGDTLWNIALAVYGDGYAWTTIAELNNIIDSDSIFPQTELKLRE